MKVFISHISEEAPLASVLKEWVEAAFLGLVEVFVSQHDISLGQQWFQRLEEELTDAKAMLVLCSKRSILMPWINFETGAVHTKGIPVIPICYAGITTATLPAPLSFFQGLDATAGDFAERIMADLGKNLGYPRPPAIRYEEMTAKVQEALDLIGEEWGQNSTGELVNLDPFTMLTEKIDQLANLISQQALGPDDEEEPGPDGGEEPGDMDHPGYVDHFVVFTEKTAELTSYISEFARSTNELVSGTDNFSRQVEQAGNNPSTGTPRYLQRIAGKFGGELNVYAGKTGDLNRKYGETLLEIRGSLQSMVTFATFESKEEFDGFLVTLDETGQAVLGWKHSVVQVRAMINSLPNVQREMARGARRIVGEFDTLTSNLDDTLNMIQEVELTIRRRFGNSGPE